jgi:DNA adenine methylase
MTKSPLRYPGGKTRAIKILTGYVERNFPERRTLLSPFLGGGSFELSCASRGYTVYANDLFSPLAVFWNVVKTRAAELQTVVSQECPVSKEDFVVFRNTIGDITESLDIAKAYFIVNRCSFSGATFCGGFSAQASSGRLNRSAIERLGQVDMTNVTVSNLDGIQFLREHPETNDTIVYADPPYYISTYIYGKDGDLHEEFDHKAFAELILTRKDWILSYNDCPYIRELYVGCRIHEETWAYGMDNGKKKASELIILPPL